VQREPVKATANALVFRMFISILPYERAKQGPLDADDIFLEIAVGDYAKTDSSQIRTRFRCDGSPKRPVSASLIFRKMPCYYRLNCTRQDSGIAPAV
jgi:hypothetical protein